MNRNITPQALRARLDAGERLRLIDVRSPQEFAEAHVPGTMNVPMDEIDARMDDLAQDETLVLICQGGGRASMTCEKLNAHRDDLLVLEGGTSAWQKADLPVVRTTRAKLPMMRQVQLVAGPLALIGAVLALTVNPMWALLSGFVGAGLTLAGATGFCGMANLLALLPWNRPIRPETAEVQR